MPSRKSGANTQVEDILARHNPEVRALVERLRQVIRETVPAAVETANFGWHSLNYRHPRSGYFCGLFPQNDSVNVIFEFGVLLPDPDGLLKGDGKQVRYVPLKQEADIRVRALKKLIRAALDLPEKREVKLGLIKSSARPVSESGSRGGKTDGRRR